MEQKERIEMAKRWHEQQMKNIGCSMPLCVFIIFVILSLSSCATRKVIEYRDRDVNHYITKVEKINNHNKFFNLILPLNKGNHQIQYF